MKTRVGVAVLLGLGLLVVAVILMGIVRQRRAHDQVSCLNNFRELGQFAAQYEKSAKDPRESAKPELARLAVPPGTIVNPALPYESRLSWIADSLELLNQKRQPTAALAGRLERTAPWDSERNRELSQTPLVLFLCPGAAPEQKPGDPAITQYVGLAGIGPDGATLGLGPPVPSRAGCFRYDEPTPLLTIRNGDGLSSTLLFAETRRDLGPWIRGGPSTVRMLDVSEGAPPFVGGQFGGNYPGIAGFGLADGGARFFTDRLHPNVIRSMMTINGKGEDPLIGE
jgi:hypothetical protein